MGRTDAVIPLLGPPRHADVGWQSRNPRSGASPREGGHMRASHRDPATLPSSTVTASDPRPPFRSRRLGWVRLPHWVRLPGRTVRTRLTILYGILFVFSGALLLTISSGVAVGTSSSEAGPAAINSASGSPLDQANA